MPSPNLLQCRDQVGGVLFVHTESYVRLSQKTLKFPILNSRNPGLTEDLVHRLVISKFVGGVGVVERHAIESIEFSSLGLGAGV